MNNEMSSLEKKLTETFELFLRADWRKKQTTSIRPSEVRVLLCVKNLSDQTDDGVSISDISKRLAVTSPTVTQMVKQLIKFGYVESFNDPKDKRITLLRMTESGKALAQKALERYKILFSGLVEKLGEEQSETLIDLLNQVYVYFNEFINIRGEFKE
ncbi:MarR family winged helix-turn-helix transcriptional regulator [Paenibacillus eucommiae]|uniref:DNA-binding MarR family transcriptional regulator n=1 Tax=Paenibacillus eucommiae TaxID=1355755 RepID=A0ABS4IMC0_9BACL|nr:winged helix DNA-binding protein [Paenibacillus eucommiae]MBP1988719.1 DNA-binding MarR family transcriptional regulator [Paenibacillus eucommiae]